MGPSFKCHETIIRLRLIKRPQDSHHGNASQVTPLEVHKAVVRLLVD